MSELVLQKSGSWPEEAALWSRWRNEGDRSARETLLEMHLPYARQLAAVYFARRFNDEIEFDDYLQSATVGLIEALDRFDPELGAQFRTYAARRMHGAMLDDIEHATEKQQQITASAQMLQERRDSIADDVEGGRPQTPAARTNEQVLKYVAEAGIAFAMSWMLDGSGMFESDEPEAVVPFYRNNELRELRKRIVDLVQSLPDQERAVVEKHYFDDMPFESIATLLDLSRGRVSQIHKKALLRLREVVNRQPCDYSI